MPNVEKIYIGHREVEITLSCGHLMHIPNLPGAIIMAHPQCAECNAYSGSHREIKEEPPA